MYKSKKKVNWEHVYLLFITAVAIVSIVGNAAQNHNYAEAEKFYEREIKSLENKTVYLKDEVRNVNIDELHNLYKNLKEEYNNLYESGQWITCNTNVSKSITRIKYISSLANNNDPHDYKLFIQLATEFNVDIGFAYATWVLETGYGSSTVWQVHNNPAGIIKLDGSGEYQTYASKEEGLRAMFGLIDHYCKNGNDTISEIREIWSEADDTEKIISIWKNVLVSNEK